MAARSARPVPEQLGHGVLEHPLGAGRDAPAGQVERQRQVPAGVGEAQAGARLGTDPVAAEKLREQLHRLVTVQCGEPDPANTVEAQ